ncbi:hypothetical protein ABCR94_33400 [Streptomyces sp. 21So2-11]|uniref:hypothetical protein n=1 Tax=Streptomyces sp. 21So2-11 TaxID=3144408 RepID=UPI00321B3C8C
MQQSAKTATIRALYRLGLAPAVFSLLAAVLGVRGRFRRRAGGGPAVLTSGSFKR